MVSDNESGIIQKKTRILIVDDDTNMLFGVSRTLAKAVFDVSVSSDGRNRNTKPRIISGRGICRNAQCDS